MSKKKNTRCKKCAEFEALSKKRERQIADAFADMMLWMGVDPFRPVDLDKVLTPNPEENAYSPALAEEAHEKWVRLTKKYESEGNKWWYGHLKNKRG